MRTTRLLAEAAATALAAGAVLAGTGTAAAVDIRPYNDGRSAAIILTHAETVTASQIGAGTVINAVLGNDRWGVTLDRDSRYQNSWYFRPDKRQTWSDVTGQQVIAEAAAHPGGRVALGITPSSPDYPLWVQQVW